MVNFTIMAFLLKNLSLNIQTLFMIKIKISFYLKKINKTNIENLEA